jgi:aryl-alcohol dehydrogenase-like predicted oxidoreductase
MKFLKIAGIDRPVSVLGLGTGTSVFAAASYDRAAELMDAFVAAGGNCVDAAAIYGFGESEKTLGRWLRARGMRQSLVLVSKGCHPIVDPQDIFAKPWEPRVTPQAIQSDLSESLERLQTDSIDLYLVHRDDENYPVGPLIETLNAEQARGRIRAFGASNWSIARIVAANAYAAEHGLNGFAISSMQFSLARPGHMYFPGTLSASDEDLAWHTSRQFPLLAWSSLSAGYLTSEDPTTISDRVMQSYETVENAARRKRSQILAARKGYSPAQLAVSYVLHQPFPVIALIGPTSGEHLNKLLESTQVTIDDSEKAYLERG